MEFFESREPLELESGAVLPELTLAYSSYGRLNEACDNVIWVCHALTANSHVQEWWPGMVGPGLAFDTSRYFVICVNIPGSCYGSTGPLTIDPRTTQRYYKQFPLITIRDMVRAFQRLADHLGIRKITLLAGGSMGGYQVLEWALMRPDFIDRLFLIATSAKESPLRIAIHAAQRLAIEADSTWGEPSGTAAAKGLKAARAIGLLTYRNPTIFEERQSEEDEDKLDDFKAASYINYQGDKLVERFNAYSYWTLTRSMDTHNIARGRAGSIKRVLSRVSQEALIIGISSDLLCQLHELELMAKHIPQAELVTIDSAYGHDGFLTETTIISAHLRKFLQTKSFAHDKS